MGFRDMIRRLSGSAAQPPSPPRTAGGASRTGLGGDDIEVSGEHYCTNSIAQVFAAAGRPLGGVILYSALLVPEPNNPYDQFAVIVYVDGHHIGYVPAQDAPWVQPIVKAYAARTGQHLTVPARMWACCEDGKWSARATLSPSGVTEPEWSYVDIAEWPGDRSPDRSQRLTDTGRQRRAQEAGRACEVDGRDFELLKPQITAARTSGDDAKALAMLQKCIDAAERQARVWWERPAAWPTEQAAVLLRKQKDYSGEVAVLERFLLADPIHAGTRKMRDRLTKARELSGEPDPVTAPESPSGPRYSAPQSLELTDNSNFTPVTLPEAVELSYENDQQEAIQAVFVEIGAGLGTAVEVDVALREFRPSGQRYSVIAVYAGGRLIGYVSSSPHMDLVREVVRTAVDAGAVPAVRCRIFATDTPTWSARATLGAYEQAVAYVDEPQSAAEGRANEAIMAHLREQRLAAGGQEAADQAQRLVRGRDVVEWVETIKQLRRDGNDDDALVLLTECILASERDSAAHSRSMPTWYTEQAAIILRKRGDYAGEIAVLERYLSQSREGKGKVSIAERLVKARAVAEKRG